ncbi:MAG TPA: hypothetical protein VHE30_14805 [Polyangiaceae bacterium]|nr:hypothetical protein [Polyangiaceae bacterium]
MTVRVSRRSFLAAALVASRSSALGRKPYGGVLRLSLPFAVDAVDPFSGDDVASALFGPALADPLFLRDGEGRAFPVLADGPPRAENGGAVVSLRPGLVSARGKSLGARDVLWSLERASAGAGRPAVASLPRATLVEGQPLAARFPGADPAAVSDALATSAVPIVPKGAANGPLDGTGAFVATLDRGTLVLERNERAARGPSFLDRIVVVPAPDLATALRAFESGDADVGFLGRGLHRARTEAVDFRTEPFGAVLLRTGPEAKSWGAPGIAAALVDGLDPSSLSHLGLVKPAARTTAVWGGPAAEIVVDQGSAYLVEVARVVARALSASGHELRVTPLARAELRTRIAGGHFSLAIDFSRRPGTTERDDLLGLLRAADPRLVDRPPPASVRPETILRTLPLAVIGTLSVAGARASDVIGLEAWDLGSVTRKKAP